jgi:hypothetical protein
MGLPRWVIGLLDPASRDFERVAAATDSLMLSEGALFAAGP